jgi:hypothetical protein
MADLWNWLGPGSPLLSTVIALALGWTLGRLAAAVLMSRIPRWVPNRQRAVADAIVGVLRHRIPRWGLLVGVWLAAGFWPLTPEGRLLVERSVFVLATLSATLAAAAIASHLVGTLALCWRRNCRSAASPAISRGD